MMNPRSNSAIFSNCGREFHSFSSTSAAGPRHEVQVPLLHPLNFRTFDPDKTVC